MITIKAKKRECDDYGCGHFGASRGERTHKGEDYAALAGSECMTPVSGTVTKLGYPYADDLDYRYVQITDNQALKHRVFYVEPSVEVGDYVTLGKSVIGTVQNISKRYDKRTMTNHVHYEIKKGREYIDPKGV